MKKVAIFLIIFLILFKQQSLSKTLTLNQVVKRAISNNYLIKIQKENLEAARYSYLSSVSDMFPKIDFSYNYTHLKDKPYTVSMGRKTIIGDRNKVEWFLRLSQPIFTGFALSTAKEIAKLGIDLNKIYEKEAILDVALDAKIAYFNILLLEKRLMVAQETVKQLKAHLTDAKQFYKEQIIPLNDLLKSKVALADAIQNQTKAQNALKLAKSRLNTILTNSIDSDFSVEDIKNIEIGKIPNIEKLYQKALSNRPLIAALKIQIQQAKLNTKLAASSYYPHISVFGEYQQKGRDVLASKNNFGNQHNAMIGIQINWQIFDSFKTHYDIESAEHKVFALNQRLNEAKQQVKLSVKQAYLDLQTAIENIKTAKVALKEAKENYRITDIRYKNQLATSTDVLDARTYLTQAEMNYYTALYGYYIAKAKLRRALGEY
ncbi:TolC family protein [Hippea alviniae]|uniref:TolC family protein n=1 Tax=Hippea alviniae TaxID=1279027 RepID=UPI0003B48548|nr:TolC family protein [Hippea alviniae]